MEQPFHKDFLRQTPQHAETRKHLKELLANRQANGIIFTTMQKFEESSEALSTRRNIVVIADEAHRGQYGLTEKVVVNKKDNGEIEAKTVIGTARIIRDSLPNATYIGFTGIPIYRRTNVVKSEKFSEIIQSAMNRYLNGMLTNEEVIQELLRLAKDIAAANAEGEKMGLTADELAFYDALTKPQAIKDFYEHDELIALTKELTDLLRKNRTMDWQKKESARAGMRRLVKRLLKKHKYPPEGMDDAVQTVMSQCEMWTDHVMEASWKVLCTQCLLRFLLIFIQNRLHPF